MRFTFAFFFTILLFSNNLFSNNKTIADSLKATIKDRMGESRVNSLNRLSGELVDMKQTHYAKSFAHEALDLAEEIGYKPGIADAYDQLGMVYLSKYDYTNAMKSYVEGLKIRDAMEDKKGIATSKNNIGKVFFLQEDPASGEDNLVSALAIREQINDREGMADTHKNLADLYLFKKVYGKAQEHYLSAFNIRRDLEDYKGAAAIASHLGRIVTDLGDYEGALVYFNMSLDLNSSIEDLPNLAEDFNNITNTYIAQGDFEAAADENDRAFSLRTQLNDKLGQAESLKNYGIIFSELGEPEEAKGYLQKCTDILSKLGTVMGKQDIYKAVSNVYFKMKDYRNAYQYQLAFVKEKEAFFNKEKSTALLELTTKYESEFEAEKQTQRITNLEKEQTYNSRLRYFLFALLGLGALFMISLFNSYNRKKKDNAKLRAMNDEIKKQKEEIDLQNDLLQEKNDNLDVLNSKLVDEMAERESIERSSFARDRFLATMSHEMRTPMNIIIGLTHLLLDEDPRPEQVEHLRTLQFSANNLVVFINDVLDFSKIEAGKIILEQRDFSIRETFEDVKKRFELQAKENKIQVNCTIDKKIPEEVTGDSVRLNQIITNLMGNCIKHTKNGNIDINVKLREMNKKEMTLVCTISDTGEGMEQEQLMDMFKNFKRSATDIFDGYENSGLGLAITKRLVDLQNGKIEAVTKPGEGTTFTLYLPFKLIDESKKASDKNNTAKEKTFTHLEGNRILLVEDNKINQLVVAKLLRKLNMDVVTADNGIEALEAIDKMYFDLVLMDIQMPKMDGYRATAEIRKNTDPRKRDVPIIALTASAFLTEKEKAKLFGMNDHVGKPFGQEDLLDKISDCLAIHKKVG